MTPGPVMVAMARVRKRERRVWIKDSYIKERRSGDILMSFAFGFFKFENASQNCHCVKRKTAKLHDRDRDKCSNLFWHSHMILEPNLSLK